REELEGWRELRAQTASDALGGPAHDILAALASRGAMFPQELEKAARLLPAHLEMGLAELLAQGAVTGDSVAAVRQMLAPPPSRRRRPWSWWPAGCWRGPVWFFARRSRGSASR